MPGFGWVNGLINVKLPMMPRGVEHLYFALPKFKEMYVKLPMMPRGVEHVYTCVCVCVNCGSRRSEASNDAARR